MEPSCGWTSCLAQGLRGHRGQLALKESRAFKARQAYKAYKANNESKAYKANKDRLVNMVRAEL